MNRFISFLSKIYVPLLFIILEVLAINYYSSTTSYTKAKMLTTTNSVLGVAHKHISDVGDYFGLRRENNALLGELAELSNSLSMFREAQASSELSLPSDTLNEYGELIKYRYIPASIINNSTSRQQNYILLDKGERDGIRMNMAVVTPDMSIVGYVSDVSSKFSIVISLLNVNFHTGGKIKGKEYFGSILWDGLSSRYATLTEVPKHADIAVGDRVVTGYSSIFPPDISIGTIESFELVRSTYYEASVRLSADLAKASRVFVVSYSDLEERRMLEGLFFEVENPESIHSIEGGSDGR